VALDTPLFDNVSVTNGDGRTIAVLADGAGRLGYIAGLKDDGQDSDRTWLSESFTTEGGTDVYALSSTSDSARGPARSDAPPSFRESEACRSPTRPGR
jgi:putative alpha-1,2-mannosidase